MTNKEQNDYWLKFHRFQVRQENIYTPKINAALKAQIEDYIRTKDIIYVRSSGLYGVLLDLYKTVGVSWAWHTRGMIKKDGGGQMGFSERVVSFMRDYFSIDLLNDAEGITQTTIKLIQQVLSDAALSGASFDDMVEQLTSSGMTPKRARLIARTETVAAANAAAMANAKASNSQVNKIWIAARDNRTRKHHVEINQTVIPLLDKFIVGGMPMDCPGDKSGGAAEVCNCRCAVAFENTDGKPDRISGKTTILI